jgi:hypothetical protein
MSIAPSADIKKVYDPRLEFVSNKSYVVTEGPGLGQSTYQTWLATATTNTMTTIPITIPSERVAVDRMLLYRTPVAIRCTGTVTNGNLSDGTNMAFKPWPLANAKMTESVTIQANGFSNQTGDIIPAMMHYVDYADFLKSYSLTPSGLDMYQRYEDWKQQFTGGANLNMLGGYGDTSFVAQGRSGFPMNIITLNATTFEATAVLVEPIFISPLAFRNNQSGLVGITQINYNVQWKSPLSQFMWSVDDSLLTLTECTLSFVAQTAPLDSLPTSPGILVNFIAPKQDFVLEPLISYNYNQLFAVSQAQGNVTAGTSFTIQMNSQRLNQIPRRMFIYAKDSDSPGSETTYQLVQRTQTYARIDNIQVSWDSVNSIIGSAAAQQLFMIASRNGYKGTWADWYTHSGGVMCVDFTKDLGMNPGDVVGSNSPKSLQVQATFTNISSETRNLVMWVVFEYEGLVNIRNGQVEQSLGSVELMDLIKAKTWDLIPVIRSEDAGIAFGGDFASKLKSFASKLKKAIPQAFDFAKKIADKIDPGLGKDLSKIGECAEIIGKNAARIAPVIGLGLPAGGRRGRPKKRAGVRKRKGGAFIDNIEMNQRLLELDGDYDE